MGHTGKTNALYAHNERVSTMAKVNDVKGNKATDSKVTTTPATVTGETVVTAQAVTVEDKKPHVHVQNSIAPKPVTVGNDTYEIGNKRAYACAMYVVCFDAMKDKGKAIALCIKLLSYGNIGYSKQKGHMLKGNEVTSTGMVGYSPYVPSTGAVKPWAPKLLAKGEDYEGKTTKYETVCKHILATYGDMHGAKAMLQVSKPK